MRALLLMTTHTYRAAAFLAAARAEDVELVVGSDRRQALERVHPSGHLTLDFSDPESAVAAIAGHAAGRALDAVIAVDDDGVLLAARAARWLGLPHAAPDAVAATRDKRLLRERLAAAGAAVPGFVAASAADDPTALAARVPYPCVVKPVSLSASRGVIRADGPQDFVAAFRRCAAVARAAMPAHPAPDLLVEQYVPGVEVAVECLLSRGALRTLAVFDKPDPLEGPYFEETLYVTPSRLEARATAAVVRAVEQAAAALGLDHGPVHAEVRWDGRRAVVVEIAARSIGGLCSRALRFTGGASLEQLVLRHALGQPVEGIERETAASGVMMIPIPAAGILMGVAGLEAARAVPGIDDIRLTIPIGDRLVPLPEGSRYLGFIFARGAGPEQVEEALRAAHGALRFEIQAGAATAVSGGRAGGQRA